jgi:hypothetical protein
MGIDKLHEHIPNKLGKYLPEWDTKSLAMSYLGVPLDKGAS